MEQVTKVPNIAGYGDFRRISRLLAPLPPSILPSGPFRDGPPMLLSVADASAISVDGSTLVCRVSL
jgi:hypothetical protein